MFGEIFSRKNDSPSTAHSPEDPSSHFPEKPQEEMRANAPEHLGDLDDFLQIERTQNEISLRQNGIKETLTSMFTVPARPQQRPSSPDKLEAISFEKESLEEKGREDEDSPHEITASSESDLITQVKNEYAASIFFDKARDVLTRRGVSEKNMSFALEDVFTKMAQKRVESFKGAALQQLFEYGLDEFDAENYIYWRLNEHLENNPMYLIAENAHEELVADNFVSDALLEKFHKREDAIVGTTEEQETAQEIVTSEKIDALLDEINAP